MSDQKPIKTCKCGREFMSVPSNARVLNEPDEPMNGAYWECSCGSTLAILDSEKKAAYQTRPYQPSARLIANKQQRWRLKRFERRQGIA